MLKTLRALVLVLCSPSLLHAATGDMQNQIPALGDGREFFVDGKNRRLACLPGASGGFVLVNTLSGASMSGNMPPMPHNPPVISEDSIGTPK